MSNWVMSGGIAIVFLLMAAESCGIPFPSEVIMPAAGIFAAQGQLNFFAAVVAGAAGNLAGSLIAYVVARRYGEPVLLGPGRRIGIRPSHVEMADGWFRRFGLAAVFFGRLLPVIRTYISFPAGLAKVEPLRFSVLTFAGALPWCFLLTWLGAQVGANLDSIAGPIEKLAVVLAVLVAAVIVAWFIRGRRRSAGAGAA
ncbi:MAG: DedA family protein [Candidatus Dormibacteria bacterium]